MRPYARAFVHRKLPMLAQQPLYASARKRNSVPKRGTNLLHHRHGEPIATRLIRGSDFEELLPTEVQIRPVIGGVVAAVIPVSVV